MVARRAHNPKAVGSNPAPATKKFKPLEEILLKAFFFFLPYSYPGLKTHAYKHNVVLKRVRVRLRRRHDESDNGDS